MGKRCQRKEAREGVIREREAGRKGGVEVDAGEEVQGVKCLKKSGRIIRLFAGDN